MFDLDAIRKRAEIQLKLSDNTAPISEETIDILALLDELERTQEAAKELREALKNEASNFKKLGEAHIIDLSGVYDYAAEALAKTKWLEEVATVKDYLTVQDEGSRSAIFLESIRIKTQ